MKIIGITGKSGAGKTSLANFFDERPNVGVIHLDNILNGIKEDKFQNQITDKKLDNRPVLLSSNLRYFINNHKILFKIFMGIKKAILKKPLQEEIRKFKGEGKDAVIIEGIHLTHMTDPKIFNSIIFVRRPYRKREKALLKREGITKMEMIERDLPFKKQYTTCNLQKFDYVIENQYGEEELKAASEKIYDEVVGIKTFDERYVVKNIGNGSFKNIVKAVKKTAGRKISRDVRE